MKILKIEFENINSLRGKHQIDFRKEPFKTNALFAITGPTGSGKSTILDVISLALFNQVPRLGRITRNEIIATGAILTRNQKEASAAVTYSCKNGSFVSTWSISTNRNENLRDYDMELANVDTGALFDLKKSDIPAKNEELIGLNYNQFIKSVVLAQGEFAQFLQAKKDERGALLEKITGTGIYRRLGQLAYEKYKHENQEIKEQQVAIAIKTGELLEPEICKKYKEELAAHEQSITPLTSDIETLQQKITLKQSIARQEKEIEIVKENQEKEGQKLLYFDKNQGISLKNHEKVEPLAQQITLWDQCHEKQQELLEEEKRNTENTQQLVAHKKTLYATITSFTGQETPVEKIADALQQFAARVDKLQQERQEKLNAHKALTAQFKSTVRETGFSLGKDIKSDRIELKNRLKQSENGLKTLKVDLNMLDLSQTDGEKKHLREEIKLLNSALSLNEKISTATINLGKVSAELDKLHKQLQALPLEIELSKSNKERYWQEREKLQVQQENKRLQASLEQHRHDLKNGEACPLCGALEHPFATGLPTSADNLETALQLAEKEYNAWNSKYIQQLTEMERAQKDKVGQDATRETQEKELQQLQDLLKQLLTGRDLSAASSWQNTVENTEHQLETLELYEKKKRYYDALSTGDPLLEKMEEVIASGASLRKAIDMLYTGNDIYGETQELQNKWISLDENLKNAQQKNQELLGKRSETGRKLHNLAENLLPQVNKIGFNTIIEAKSTLLEHSVYTHLRRERENLIREIENLEATVKTLQKQLFQDMEKDTPLNQQELLQNLEKSRERLNELREKCEGLKRQLHNDAERIVAIADLKTRISQKENEIKRWRLLNELIGDANGKSFNEFAQHLTLTQLLRLANMRLKDLSDRYRLDTPQENEDDSLVAIDEHMGGQRRSVKTLSGGETFILSLSMALALSDLASRNVEINSLFIDEGFGTLDPETLDQTLDTLERLQASSSKTIGIISHVDSLKERIATQIQLKRNGQGYSSLSIK
jgi:exonuclease SbcC